MNDRVSTPLLALVICIAVLVVACAGSTDVGVRPDYEQKQIIRVAVVPFYSIGSFGLANPHLDQLISLSEQAAVESLRAEGFEVVEPEAFRQHLVDEGVENRFDDGVLLRSSLANYFEPSDETRTRPALEVATVTELYEEEKLPAEALFFGELVYHTRTQCRSDASEYNEQAEVIYRTKRKQGASTSPCMVSHFRAKLVDATTGETMWFNRKLLQTHFRDGEQSEGLEHVAETVTRTIGGDTGLEVFIGGFDTAGFDEESDLN